MIMMELDVYYFTLCVFLFIVFTASIYFSFNGYGLATHFLWSWAVLLVLAAPFLSLIPRTITTHIAGVTLLFFVYTLFLFSRRSQRKLEFAHEETRRAHEETRLVLRESNNRTDEERRRITRQLHDDMNPKLVLAKMELQKLVPLINKNITDHEESERAREIVNQVLGRITSVYEDSRDIIRNTRIELIDSMGLTAALESLVGHYKGILEKPTITFKHNLPKRPALPEATAVNAYRIIQEALLNVIKHAEAKNVTITVQNVGKRFNASILDDGVGINAKHEHGNGIGLIDMRERARVLGTDLLIENARGGGTNVSFSFSGRD